MLLAEELALVAVKPDTGRHVVGVRGQLNACLAGLLVAELMLEGAATPAEANKGVFMTGQHRPESPTLAAAAEVVAAKAPKIKAILSHMDRGLRQHLQTGTWDTAMAGLVATGALAPATQGRLPSHDLVDPAVRDGPIDGLRAAAAGDGPMAQRTALVLSMTGPANLLEVVAVDRGSRRHARRRIDHALDGSDFERIGKAVRQLIAEAAAAATSAGT